MIQTFDPVRTLINTRNGAVENLKVNSANAGLATGNDQSVIAAVAGKIHRVIGWHFSAGLAGNTTIVLKNGAGGSGLLRMNLIAGARDFGNTNFAGYFETSVNTALVADIGTTAGVVNLFYVTYTP